MSVVWIAGFGVLGILSRFGLDRLAAGLSLPAPWMTWAINAVGSFLAGAIYTLATERSVISGPLALALMVGFCGGFTTFSAYSLQSFQLLERDEWATLALYFIGSPLLGLLAAGGGILLVRRLVAA